MCVPNHHSPALAAPASSTMVTVNNDRARNRHSSMAVPVISSNQLGTPAPTAAPKHGLHHPTHGTGGTLLTLRSDRSHEDSEDH